MTYSIALVNPKHNDISRLILRLHKECFPSDVRPPIGFGWWWLIYCDGEPAGFAGMIPSKRWLNCGYFCRAGILPEHRGKKLQRRLIRVRMAMAKKVGMYAVLSDTRDNPSSANNLIECGFRMYTPKYPWGYTNTSYWRKIL